MRHQIPHTQTLPGGFPPQNPPGRVSAPKPSRDPLSPKIFACGAQTLPGGFEIDRQQIVRRGVRRRSRRALAATGRSMATKDVAEPPLSAQHVRHVMHLSQAGPVRRRLPSPLPSYDPPAPPPPAPLVSAHPCAADQADRERRSRGGPGVQLRVPLLHRKRGAPQGAARGPQRGQRGRHALGAAGTRLQVIRRRPPGAP